MIVKLKHLTAHYSDLTFRQHYTVIGIEADDLRLLNDQGRPYLYPYQLFEEVDSCKPDDWVIEFGDDGEQYAYPSSLNAPGFFEDFFDNKREAVVTFWQAINQRLTIGMAAAA
ncbi:MAG TPA: hypothetical protein G4N96_01495 [Chloroflexi bacterium]|nr:MAG: hypothetical protein B6243_09500 [Anaerolineaceae bacterium 4572_5.2]HEY83776.1 hypothetical protein [Chloroflexota bacterium]